MSMPFYGGWGVRIDNAKTELPEPGQHGLFTGTQVVPIRAAMLRAINMRIM
jgi:hypothetical protein